MINQNELLIETRIRVGGGYGCWRVLLYIILSNTSKKQVRENHRIPKKHRDRNIKKPAPLSGDIFWKRAYVLLCIVLLCLTAGQLFLGLSDPYSGMDYRNFAATVQCLNHGEDPYILPNIHQYTHDIIPFNYAPHTLLFLWCLQFFFIFQSIWIYYAILFTFLVVSGYMIVTLDQKPQYLFLITLLLTSFISTFWNFFNGNKEILFLFLFAGILAL